MLVQHSVSDTLTLSRESILRYVDHRSESSSSVSYCCIVEASPDNNCVFCDPSAFCTYTLFIIFYLFCDVFYNIVKILNKNIVVLLPYLSEPALFMTDFAGE